ncbi:MAG: hypothetical protein WC480_01990 [Patescibacteria group bacterium]
MEPIQTLPEVILLGLLRKAARIEGVALTLPQRPDPAIDLSKVWPRAVVVVTAQPVEHGHKVVVCRNPETAAWVCEQFGVGREVSA